MTPCSTLTLDRAVKSEQSGKDGSLFGWSGKTPQKHLWTNHWQTPKNQATNQSMVSGGGCLSDTCCCCCLDQTNLTMQPVTTCTFLSLLLNLCSLASCPAPWWTDVSWMMESWLCCHIRRRWLGDLFWRRDNVLMNFFTPIQAKEIGQLAPLICSKHFIVTSLLKWDFTLGRKQTPTWSNYWRRMKLTVVVSELAQAEHDSKDIGVTVLVM